MLTFDVHNAGLRAALCAFGLLLRAGPAFAGVLTGPIQQAGVTADLIDVLQLPATAGAPPLARVNGLAEVPDGSGRLFANDLRGPLYAISGATVQPYFDLSLLRPDLKTLPGLASGFVSFAFHPDFASNGLLYTVHSEFVGLVPATLGPAIATTIEQHSILTEWTASDPSANAFSGTSRELLRIASPHRFHNLGQVAFDPTQAPGDADYGLLYLGGGDYGSVAIGEPDQLQRVDTPFGAVLRIDPQGGDGSPYSYGIPAGNPFAGDSDPTTLGEIYAWGFRNAHRISWDDDGTAFVSDIGEDNVEEVNVLAAGGNYGWPLREGTFALDPVVDPGTVFALPPNDASFGFRYPVAQYDHEEGSAVAGGFVYRASASSPLHGQFVFGDIVSGRLLYADAAELKAADDGDPATTAQVHELELLDQGVPTTLLGVVRDALASPSLGRADLRLATDGQGALYVTTKQDGFLRELVPAWAPAVPALPGPAWAAIGFGLLFAARSRDRASGRRAVSSDGRSAGSRR